MDTNPPRTPFLFEFFAKWLTEKFRENRLPLISTMIIGMLGYTFAFTNKFINHDEVYNLFGKGATVDSGRWGLGGLDSIFPNYSMPWIYGILTLALMSVAVAIMVRVFSVQSKPLQVLLGGSIIVFPSLTGTFAFMFTSSSYAVSFLFAVLAVWALCRKEWWMWGFGLGCMIFSLSIYQSYIAISASMLVLILIQELLRGEEISRIVRKGILYVIFLVLSLGLYYIATQVVLVLKDVEFNEYAADRVSFSLASVLNGIVLAYKYFFLTFSELEFRLIPTEFIRTIHYLCLAGAALLLVLWGIFREKKEFGRYLLLAALIAILPLAINCMYLFTSEDAVHTLVLYGFAAVYLLLIVVAEACISLYFPGKAAECCRRLAVEIVTFGLAVIVIANTYIANMSTLALHLHYETTYAFYTALMTDIRSIPEFTEDSKIAVIGSWQYPDHYGKYFEFTYDLQGLYSSTPDLYSKEKFVEYYLGVDLAFVSQTTAQEIRATDRYKEMPCYPYNGSIQMFDDILVVKLSY